MLNPTERHEEQSVVPAADAQAGAHEAESTKEAPASVKNANEGTVVTDKTKQLEKFEDDEDNDLSYVHWIIIIVVVSLFCCCGYVVYRRKNQMQAEAQQQNQPLAQEAA